jgi:SAM-dependent methyltransferase
MNSTLREIYNGFADIYESNRGAFDISDILNSFYTLIEIKKGTLLDLGCGAGEPVARHFVDNSWLVTGVDFSERMLELASIYVPEMKTIRGDIMEIEFEANQFDAITATYSLFHIPASTHADMFKNFINGLNQIVEFYSPLRLKNSRVAKNSMATKYSWVENFTTVICPQRSYIPF